MVAIENGMCSFYNSFAFTLKIHPLFYVPFGKIDCNLMILHYFKRIEIDMHFKSALKHDLRRIL